ncbi:LPXTG cell wall anchor domain-containing protein [Arthrobacter pigmenti]
MKRLPLLVTLVLGASGIAGFAGNAPAAADGGTDRIVTIPLGWEASGPGTDRLSMPLFNETSIVPGDSGKQAVAVRNDGPANGVLTASIVNVELGGNPADPFYDELLLNGQSVSEYEHRKTAVLKTQLDRGETTTVDLAYLFPEDSVSGNGSDAEMKVSFDVVLQIRETVPTAGERPGTDEKPGNEVPGSGETPGNEVPERNDVPAAEWSLERETLPMGEGTDQSGQAEMVAGQGAGDDDGGAPEATPAASGDGLAYTGTDLVWLVGAGLLLALLGGLMMLIRRRSEDPTS